MLEGDPPHPCCQQRSFEVYPGLVYIQVDGGGVEISPGILEIGEQIGGVGACQVGNQARWFESRWRRNGQSSLFGGH